PAPPLSHVPGDRSDMDATAKVPTTSTPVGPVTTHSRESLKGAMKSGGARHSRTNTEHLHKNSSRAISANVGAPAADARPDVQRREGCQGPVPSVHALAEDIRNVRRDVHELHVMMEWLVSRTPGGTEWLTQRREQTKALMKRRATGVSTVDVAVKV